MKKLLLLLLLPLLAQGENRIGIGFGFIQGQDNLSTRGNETINTLGKPQDTFSYLLPLVDLHLSMRRDGITYFFRTQEEQSPSLQVGLRGEVGNIGRGEFYIGVNPFRRVWEDPYLVGAKREKTQRREFEIGTRLTKEKASVGIRLSYVDVEKDRLGEREPSLRRDGLLLSLRPSYRYSLGSNTSISPSLKLEYMSARGRASSYAGYGLSLTGNHTRGDLLFNLTLSVGQDRYLEKDPLLGRTREETNYSLFLSVTRRNFFHPSVYLTTLIGYRHVSSSLDFYNRKSLLAGLITGYRW